MFYFNRLSGILRQSKTRNEYIHLHNFLNPHSNKKFFTNNEYFFNIVEKYYQLSLYNIYEAFLPLINSSFNEASVNIEVNFSEVLELFEDFMKNSKKNIVTNSKVCEVDASFELRKYFDFKDYTIGPVVAIKDSKIRLISIEDFNENYKNDKHSFLNMDNSNRVVYKQSREFIEYSSIIFTLSEDILKTIDKVFNNNLIDTYISISSKYNYKNTTEDDFFNPSQYSGRNPLNILNSMQFSINLGMDSKIFKDFSEVLEDFTIVDEMVTVGKANTWEYKYFPLLSGVIENFPKDKEKLVEILNNLVSGGADINRYDRNYFFYDLFFYAFCKGESNLSIDFLEVFIKALPDIFPKRRFARLDEVEKAILTEDCEKFLNLIGKIYGGTFDKNMPLLWQLEL